MDFHVNNLLATLVLSLVAAFGGGLAVRVINLPPMIGYLLAGILIGPATPGIIADQSMAADLAEVGVTLLLFNVGLHFSVKDLLIVRRIVVLGALWQILISAGLSFIMARLLLGWSVEASLVMGLSFSVASTAITSRFFEEKREFSTFAGRIAVGWLVVQDIVVVLAMVLFPALISKEEQQFGAIVSTLGQTLLQVAGFVVVMLFGARKYIPKLLEFVARIGSRELFTLAVIVIALGIAYGSAVLFGISFALGAFFAGVVIGESDLNHHAAEEALSMQQIFTIVFFVSVGMLVDPQTVLDMPLGVFASWVVIVIGMGLSTAVVLVAMRVPVQTAVLIGGIFSQASELSFVLCQMGYKWGVLTNADRDLIVAAAFVSIVLNPLIFKAFLWGGEKVEANKVVQRWFRRGEETLPQVLPHQVGEHVILVGHGHVGRYVAEALEKNDIPYVVVETNRRLMEKLQEEGKQVIFGDATREAVLAAANPETARLLVVTIPQGHQMRQTTALAKRLNPSLEVIARVHEETEARQMARLGITLAVQGEREIAIGLSTYALQSYGVESKVVLETMNVLRQ